MSETGKQPTQDDQQSLDNSIVKVKFGTAGIRGIYGQEVSIRETIAVCFAVNELLREGKFGLGYDSRSTSFLLATVACSAMNWYGSDVENYGMIPTPVLAYNIRKMGLHAGFSVTASHNPAEYAGVKVFGTDGIEFSLEAEHKIEQLMQKSSEYVKHGEEMESYGNTSEVSNSRDSYIEGIIRNAYPTKQKFKIIVDCANGTSGEVTPKILSELGHEVVTVNSHPSKSFPGRLPEPMQETLGETAELTRRIGADFGVAHDGDADRLVMIDEKGSVVPDYAVSSLVLKIILEKVKRGTVIISYNSSDALEYIARQAGCVVERSRLGKTFQVLYNKKGVFASEPSKMVDARWGYWEDGIYTSVLIAQYLSEMKLTFLAALKGIPKYYNYRKDLIVGSYLDYDAVKRNVEAKFPGSVEMLEEVDGVKIRIKNDLGWLMWRSSGTERKVRVYCESSSQQEAMNLLNKGVSIAQMSQSTTQAQ